MLTFNLGMKIMATADKSYCRIIDHSLLKAKKQQAKIISHFLSLTCKNKEAEQQKSSYHFFVNDIIEKLKY